MELLKSVYLLSNIAAVPLLVWIGKGVCLLAVFLILQFFLKKSSATTRHASLFSGILILMWIPVLTATLPSWQVPFLPQEKKPVPFTAAQPAATNPETIGEASTTPFREARATLKKDSRAEFKFFSLPSLFFLFVIFWSLGTILFLLKYTISIFQLIRLSKSSSIIQQPAPLETANNIRRVIHLTRSVRLFENSGIHVPITFGLLRPVIILPAHFRNWNDERLRVVLLHEMAHIKRWDWLMQMTTQAVGTFHWLNPLFWTASRKSRYEREFACDDFVLSYGEKPSVYASHLLEISNSLGRQSLPPEASVAMLNKPQLQGRLLAILDTQKNRSVSKTFRTRLLLSFSMICVLLICACNPYSVNRGVNSQQLLSELRQERAPEKLVTVVLGESLARKLPHDFTNRDNEFLRTSFENSEWQVRAAAAYALGARSASPPAALIAMALHDNRWEVRHFGAWAATRSVDQSLGEPLKKAITDSMWEVSHLAVTALTESDAETNIELLITGLDHSSWRTSHQAAWVLGRIRNKAAVQSLIISLSRADWMTRHVAAWALGEMKATEAVPQLIKSLQDDKWEVRKEATLALGRISDTMAIKPLNNALNDNHEKVRAAAEVALENF